MQEKLKPMQKQDKNTKEDWEGDFDLYFLGTKGDIDWEKVRLFIKSLIHRREQKARKRCYGRAFYRFHNAVMKAVNRADCLNKLVGFRDWLLSRLEEEK